MEYELINPSDPYTFVAADLEVAALTVFLLSHTYGAESKDGEETVPIFILGGSPRDWYKTQFGRTPDEGLKARYAEVADALESVLLGTFEDRRRYQAALDAISDAEKRKQFIKAWQDGRSSLCDIGPHAHIMAKCMRETELE